MILVSLRYRMTELVGTVEEVGQLGRDYHSEVSWFSFNSGDDLSQGPDEKVMVTKWIRSWRSDIPNELWGPKLKTRGYRV